MVNTLPYLNFIPAYVLIGISILIFFVGKAVPKISRLPVTVFFIFILCIAFMMEGAGSGSQVLFFNMIQIDSFSRLYNQLFFLVILSTVLMMSNSEEIDSDLRWENYGLLSTICLGMMFMVSSKHLLMTVVGIELVSLPSYLLVAMNKKNPASKEAALKYVLFGSFATGIMLYGMSFLFGLTGSLTFEGLWNGLSGYHILGSPIYFLAIFMTLGGIAFKISAVPFHFWTPDAYQAAPTPITAFLSCAPKVAGLALLMRFFAVLLPEQSEQMGVFISIVAMLTMTLGNFAALKQTDIKRLLAYSSISHAGFLLMGVAVMNDAGRQVVFFYIPIYLLMNLGAFMAIIYLSKGTNFQIDSYKGMIYKKPLLVVSLAVCMFSLAGIPPFAGFIGKLYLFKVVIEKEMFLLAIVAGINSVVSLYYYVYVLKVMIIDKDITPEIEFKGKPATIAFVASCAVPLVFFGIYWVPLLDWASKVVLFQ
ncbi:MAG: NADH-quinone oxidoreductase subunit N [Deltaproteobacteria bacterium]|nr:NADH-quinone oxidoreductase subunit N [Deltaproteobacteria bacterium]